MDNSHEGRVLGTVPRMTNASAPVPLPAPEDQITDKERQALAVYDDTPMDDGDVAFLLDERVTLELEGMASQWRAEDLGPFVEQVLTHSRRVVVIIARRGSDLTPRDYALVRFLRQQAATHPDPPHILPVQAVPAVSGGLWAV